MVERRTGIACLLCLLALTLIWDEGVRAEEGTPSLEFNPSSDFTPERRQKQKSQALTLFGTSVGGFGISSGSFDRPVDVAYDSEGNYYVLDAGNSRIQKFDDRDRFDMEWGSSGSREGRFREPVAIAIDQEDFIYVVEAKNHRVQKFTTEGELVLSWGSLGSTTGKFNAPIDITFDDEGNVYVLDSGNDRIQQFTDSGVFVEEWGRFKAGREGDFSRLVSIAWSEERTGYLYLLGKGSEGKGCLIQVLSLRGGRREVDRAWQVSYPEEEEEPCVPTRLEIDNEDDHVYILDHGNSILRRFTKDGRYIDAIWEVDEQFNGPLGLSIKAETRELWIADTGNNIVQRFSLR